MRVRLWLWFKLGKLGPQVWSFPRMGVSVFVIEAILLYLSFGTITDCESCYDVAYRQLDILTNAHVFTSFLDNISNRTWPNLRSGVSLRVRIDSPQQQVSLVILCIDAF